MESSKVIFKIKLGDDLRRWTCDSSPLSFNQVLDKAVQLFSIPRETAVLRYQDDEGDNVTLACDDDVQEAIMLALMAADGRKPVVRLQVCSSTEQPPSTTRVSELEGTVQRLEREALKAKQHAENLAEHAENLADKVTKDASEMSKLAEKEAQRAHKHAKDSFKALPFVQGIQEMITKLTPRGEGSADETAREALNNLHNLVGQFAQEAMPPPVQPELATHPGVACDVCQMCPVVGPRYKKKGANYDLCQADFKKLDANAQRSFICIEHPQQVWRRNRPCPPCCKSQKPQARFVEDVNIPTDTEIMPGTEFTKIWRLRNTGTAPWPANTKLVHIGGDKFEGDSVANVDPAPPGEEINVAVSLVAPSEPGRYVSYWRLAEPPSMRKFGQRIGCRWWWCTRMAVSSSKPARASRPCTRVWSATLAACSPSWALASTRRGPTSTCARPSSRNWTRPPRGCSSASTALELPLWTSPLR